MSYVLSIILVVASLYSAVAIALPPTPASIRDQLLAEQNSIFEVAKGKCESDFDNEHEEAFKVGRTRIGYGNYNACMDRAKSQLQRESELIRAAYYETVMGQACR